MGQRPGLPPREVFGLLLKQINSNFAGPGRQPVSFFVRPQRKNQRNDLRCAGHLEAVLFDGSGYLTVLSSSLRELLPRYLLGLAL